MVLVLPHRFIVYSSSSKQAHLHHPSRFPHFSFSSPHQNWDTDLSLCLEKKYKILSVISLFISPTEKLFFVPVFIFIFLLVFVLSTNTQSTSQLYTLFTIFTLPSTSSSYLERYYKNNKSQYTFIFFFTSCHLNFYSHSSNR